MTFLAKITGRGSGTWPDGEPESIRAAADAMTFAVPEPDDASSNDALNRRVNPLSIGGLTGLCSDLLREVDDRDLPRPATAMVSEQGQRISLQFGSELASHDALVQWGIVFGSDVEFSRASRKGRRLVSTTFSYYGASVEVYAYI
jgi:hypothetical protein